jgi:hypothetical protein
MHFGVFKNFINKNTGDKDKFYISFDCRKIGGSLGMQVCS